MAEGLESFLHRAAQVVPVARQEKWFETEMYAFLHFGINTFTDREWGDGKEDEQCFALEKPDCDNWVWTLQEAGFGGIILTAKHHDGFCLWDTKTTTHSVMSSPCRMDIVAQTAKACRGAGMKFGVYLSPWDRNCPKYGTMEYNNFFCDQLTELLTGYGELFMVWFDNACKEGENGRKQQYDFPRYIELIRKYQPNAVIFNDYGPDVRWCGNEAGKSREAEWAVVPTDLCRYSKDQTGPSPMAKEGSLSFLECTNKEIGSLSQIVYAKGLGFVPSEIDTSLRPGWFWHETEEPKSLSELFRIYLGSVGNNACLNLNVPPDRNGRIDQKDAKQLAAFGALLRQEFATPRVAAVSCTSSLFPTQPCYEINLSSPTDHLKYVILEEDLHFGQRIESFRIIATGRGGNQFPLYEGKTVGHRKICVLTDPFCGQNPLLREAGEIHTLHVQITAARDEVHMKKIMVY